jgi:hypothetical protein
MLQQPKNILMPVAIISMLISVVASAAFGAGRTYVPKSETNEIRYELCRLKAHEYSPGKTNCIYRRQTGGKDVIVSVSENRIQCQAEFQCEQSK